MQWRQSQFFRGMGLWASLSLVLIFLGAVGLDQVTKYHAQRDLMLYEDPTNTKIYRGASHPVFSVGNKYPAAGESSFYFGLNYQYSRNPGAAFSMFADLDESIRIPLFHAITVLAVILISFYLATTPLHHRMTRFGLIFILAGAVGNYIDRLHLTYVIDFIDVDWNIFGWRHDFAIFNIADVAINVGVISLIIDMVVHRKEHSAKNQGESNPHDEAHT